MMYLRMLFMTVIVSFCVPNNAPHAAEPMPGKQVAQSVEVETGEGEATRAFHYWLFLPKEFEAKQDAKWPLLLFLHGSGERGDDLELVKKHGPPKFVEQRPDFPLITVSPQCPRGQRWKTEELSQLLDHLTETLPVDADRIYVTGLSMGGGGTWQLAAAEPHRFAAIAPICGRADPATAEKIKHLPIWVFHGAKDTAVSLEQSAKMVEALKQAGGSPKFTVYPDAGHDAWTPAYDDDEFWTWLGEQKRSGADR